MSPDDKAPPKGALEEAVSLYDEVFRLIPVPALNDKERAILDKLHARRAALEPRLAKRRRRLLAAEELLAEVERSAEGDTCPICGHSDDHGPGCRLAATLGRRLVPKPRGDKP